MTERKIPTLTRTQIWLPALLLTGIALGILIGFRLANPTQPQSEWQLSGLRDGSHQKMEELIRYIEAKYVDPVDRQQLVEDAITSVLKELDPHSSYIPKEELQQVAEQLEGSFVGIGIEFMMLRDTPVVVSTISDGPAERAGILAGDKLLSLGDSTIAGKQLNSRDIIQILRGKQGTTVEVGIQRFPSKKIRQIRLNREEIPLRSIDAAYHINNQTAYIRISRFSAHTDKEFLAELEKLTPREQPVNLILDLRQNPGGYLQQASNILSQIFDERNRLLVYTKGHSVRRSDYRSTGRAFFHINHVAVLIDEGSASASEIIAGAIQDHDRGLIVGRRSFGKGLVQEQYQLRDGSALRLTVARYYTPSGRSIQKPYKDVEDYDMELQNRMNSGELLSINNIELEDSTRYYTSNGRVVYSSGGIVPDIFIPVDSLELDPFFQELQLLLPEFTLQVVQENRGMFPAKKESFVKDFSTPDSLLQRFYSFAYRQGTPELKKEYTRAQSRISLLLKAQIARTLFGQQAYFEVTNQQDPIVQIALKKINTEKPIAELSRPSRR